jgi:hypothetical protein
MCLQRLYSHRNRPANIITCLLHLLLIIIIIVVVVVIPFTDVSCSYTICSIAAQNVWAIIILLASLSLLKQVRGLR